jgi:hypothetical protein
MEGIASRRPGQRAVVWPGCARAIAHAKAARVSEDAVVAVDFGCGFRGTLMRENQTRLTSMSMRASQESARSNAWPEARSNVKQSPSSSRGWRPTSRSMAIQKESSAVYNSLAMILRTVDSFSHPLAFVETIGRSEGKNKQKFPHGT